MRSLIALSLNMALVIVLCPVLAAAADEAPANFVALSEITPKAVGTMTKLGDEQLATIEGGATCIGCPVINVGLNFSVVNQFNIVNQTQLAFGRNITQTAGASTGNRGNVSQRLRR